MSQLYFTHLISECFFKSKVGCSQSLVDRIHTPKLFCQQSVLQWTNKCICLATSKILQSPTFHLPSKIHTWFIHLPTSATSASTRGRKKENYARSLRRIMLGVQLCSYTCSLVHKKLYRHWEQYIYFTMYILYPATRWLHVTQRCSVKGIVSRDWEWLQLVSKDRSEEFVVTGTLY